MNSDSEASTHSHLWEEGQVLQSGNITTRKMGVG